MHRRSRSRSRSRTFVRSAVLAAFALFALGAAAPGQSAGRGLLLTVSGSENTWIRGVTLQCDPAPAGSHPRAAQACAALDAAEGDPERLAADGRMCTMEHDPVTVTARGEHRGTPVAWRETYSNSCVMRGETAAVFDF
ncbi:SSI family serine proteinase inhibitor [Streptomyces jumonjinensis]|uniref:SSI family serine proteinase inhibitor n=1 Tax=Streptomyces jumonjinensis TaxID=1945 RepID=UPI0037A3BE9C